MQKSRLLILIALCLATSCVSDEDQIIRDEAYKSVPAHLPITMTRMIGGDTLSLRSDPQFAGAISSLVFRGQEYVNSHDHGRLMQGAIAYNDRFECLNPTQAGGSRDRENRGMASTSRRGYSFATPDGLFEISTRMAYWLRPGMKCTIPGVGRMPVDNRTRLSGDTYKISHQFGLNGAPNVVHANIEYTIKESYRTAVVEALTIYTPLAFSTFHEVNPSTGALTLEPTLVPDEKTAPIILSTADGAHAIAFVSLMRGATYARFRFEDTNKISLVYRDTDGISGVNQYQAAWIVGTREEVAAQVIELMRVNGG